MAVVSTANAETAKTSSCNEVKKLYKEANCCANPDSKLNLYTQAALNAAKTKATADAKADAAAAETCADLYTKEALDKAVADASAAALNSKSYTHALF